MINSAYVRKFLSSILKKITSKLDNIEPPVTTQVANEELVLAEHKEIEQSPPQAKKVAKNKIPKKKTDLIHYKENTVRDLIDMMEVPFLALSKNRKNPICYESSDGRIKVKVSRHTEHFLASIYDWDIILFVSSKMQEIINSRSDIPPRTMVFFRHELLKTIHKHNVNTQQKRLEDSLHRLRRTAIDTTIRNEDYRYKADFGFIDSWDYTERKDIKEIRITLSQWLYDGICAQGSLLKINSEYFNLTSGIKKFLYRTARKHVGNSLEPWTFSAEKIYKKSGSEREFKKFKNDLKTATLDNDIPEYSLEWVQKNNREFIRFKRSKVDTIENLETIQKNLDTENYENNGIIPRTLDQTITDLDSIVDKI